MVNSKNKILTIDISSNSVKVGLVSDKLELECSSSQFYNIINEDVDGFAKRFDMDDIWKKVKEGIKNILKVGNAENILGISSCGQRKAVIFLDTIEVIQRQSEMILEDIKSWLDEKIPKHVMNPEVFKEQAVEKIISDEKIDNLKRDIVKLCKKLLLEGHVIGSAGNVSVRVKDGEDEFILITPSNVRHDEMAPEDILKIDMEGKVLEGARNPSVEKKMHLSVYKEREDVNAIIHAHSIYSTVLSALKLPIPPIFEEFVPYIGGEVLCADYGEAGTEELADGVIAVLEERNAVLLANHGNLCCGSHLDGAYTVLQYLERGAKIYYLAKLVKDPNLLPEDTIDYEMDIFDIFKDSKKI